LVSRTLGGWPSSVHCGALSPLVVELPAAAVAAAHFRTDGGAWITMAVLASVCIWASLLARDCCFCFCFFEPAPPHDVRSVAGAGAGAGAGAVVETELETDTQSSSSAVATCVACSVASCFANAAHASLTHGGPGSRPPTFVSLQRGRLLLLVELGLGMKRDALVPVSLSVAGALVVLVGARASGAVVTEAASPQSVRSDVVSEDGVQSVSDGCGCGCVEKVSGS